MFTFGRSTIERKAPHQLLRIRIVSIVLNQCEIIASLASQTHLSIELTGHQVNYIISIVIFIQKEANNIIATISIAFITRMIVVSPCILDQLMDLSRSHCG